MKSLLCNFNSTMYLKKLFLSCIFSTIFYSANAQWSKYPTVNNPVCTESDEQLSPNIVSDGNGGSIITWYDKRNGKEYDIYAQRLDALGYPQWTADGIVVCNYSGDQMLPVITIDGTGGAIISWIDRRNGIDELYAQRINSSGGQDWNTDGVPICELKGSRLNWRITSDNSGGAVICWEDYRNTNADIYAQRINAKGTVQWTQDGLEVCLASGDQRKPRIINNMDTFLIAWEDARNSKKVPVFDIYAQSIDNAGNILWTVNGNAICNATGDQFAPSIVSDWAGGAIIAWHDIRGGSNYDVYAQKVDATGAVVWTTDGVGICAATADQTDVELSTDGFSGAILTWRDTRTSGTTYIYAQRILYSGSTPWTSNGVLICSSSGSKEKPLIISDHTGGAIIIWSDIRNGKHYDIYAQNINSTGQIQWPNNGAAVSTASGDQLNCAIVEDDYNGAFVAWNDSRSSTIDIYSQNILKDGSLGIVPEINVKGNYQTILDGDITPIIPDNTDFGSVSSPSPLKKSFKIYNSGIETLSITNIYTTGTNSSEFVPQSMKFPQDIKPHDSLSFDVTYTAVSVGISNAVLNIDNNDSNEAVYNFAIKGTFKAPEIDIKGNGISISDGDVIPSLTDSTEYGKIRMNTISSRTYSIINTGTDTLKITNINITGTNSSEFTFPSITYPRKLGPGKTMSLIVSFLPKATGLRTAVINISSNDPNESAYDFAIQGTSVVPVIHVEGNYKTIADGDLTPALNDFTDFGDVHISSQKIRKYKVLNTGSDVLTINGISIDGLHTADFTLSSMSFPVLINTNDSIEFEVTFVPLDLGTRIAGIKIDSDDDTKATYDFVIQAKAISQEINVKGNGQTITTGDNTPSVSDNTYFGKINRNGNKVNRFYVFNTGTDVLAITGITLSGPEASVFSLGVLTPASPLLPGDSAYFDLTFNPTSNGLKNASITISNNDADEGSYVFSVQGLAVSSKIIIKGNQVQINDGNTAVSTVDNTDFGSIEIPNTVLKSFKILNTGNDTLRISNLTITGTNASDFSLQGVVFPQNIAPGDSLTYSINFNPADSSIRKAIITISSNDMDVPSFDYGIQGRATKKKVGLTENRIGEQIALYPNPAQTELFISLPAHASIIILSADGKSIAFEGSAEQGINRIDLSGLATGVYIVRMQINGVVVNKKLVVNR